MGRKKWSALSGTQRAAILTLVSIEISLTAAAAVDLARRPVDQVKGSKAAWAAALIVQPIGPIAYLIAGRTTQD